MRHPASDLIAQDRAGSASGKARQPCARGLFSCRVGLLQFVEQFLLQCLQLLGRQWRALAVADADPGLLRIGRLQFDAQLLAQRLGRFLLFLPEGQRGPDSAAAVLGRRQCLVLHRAVEV